MSGQIDELCVQIETGKDTCHDLLKKKVISSTVHYHLLVIRIMVNAVSNPKTVCMNC